MSTPETSVSAQVDTPDGTIDIPYADTIQFTRNLSATSDWALAVRDDKKELNPDNESGDWADVLNDEAYADDGETYAKRFKLSVTQDEDDFAMPDGIPDQYGYDVVEGDEDESLHWAGKGVASKLYRDHLSVASLTSTRTAATGASAWSSGTTYAAGDHVTEDGSAWLSLAGTNLNHTPHSSPSWWVEADTGQLYYARDVLALLASHFGVPIDGSALSPNFLVPRMTMADGSAITWMTQVLEVTQGEWYEHEDGIVVFQPDWAATDYVRSYTAAEVKLKRLSAKSSAVVNFANAFTVARADDTGGVLAEVDKKDAPFGRQGLITLTQPVPVLSLHWDKKFEHIGQLSDFYIYGPDGPPAAPIDARECKAPPPTLQVGSTAHSVEFTLGAWVGSPVGADHGDYSIELKGDNSFGVFPDSVTSLIVKNESAASLRRGLIWDKLGPNPIVGDEDTLRTWGGRVCYKRSRKLIERTGEIFPADYPLLPGNRIRIVMSPLKTIVFTLTKIQHLFDVRLREIKTVFEARAYV